VSSMGAVGYVGVVGVECQCWCYRSCVVTVVVGASHRVAIDVDVVGADLVVTVGVESKCNRVPSCVIFTWPFPCANRMLDEQAKLKWTHTRMVVSLMTVNIVLLQITWFKWIARIAKEVQWVSECAYS
jgi:hypothetical protein